MGHNPSRKVCDDFSLHPCFPPSSLSKAEFLVHFHGSIVLPPMPMATQISRSEMGVTECQS